MVLIIQALQRANAPPVVGKYCTNKNRHFIKSKTTYILYIVFNNADEF